MTCYVTNVLSVARQHNGLLQVFNKSLLLLGLYTKSQLLNTSHSTRRMAPNRPMELEHPLSPSVESEVGSDSEPEGSNMTTSFLPPVTKNPAASYKITETHQPSGHDDDDDESGSESESESDSALEKSRKADPTIKSIGSKLMEDPAKSSTKKPSLPASPIQVKSGAGVKRTAESEQKDSKRAKKKLPVLEDEENGAKDDQKKQLCQRLWSEDDEIVILKGIMDYVAEKGTDPVNDLNVFHDFIKTSLHIDVSKTQLQDKVRRLKKKFENNASKGKQGKDRTFAKAHEQKAYDLSKKIWAPDGKLLGIDISKVNGSAKKSNQRDGKAVVSPRVDGLSSPEVATIGVQQRAGPVQQSGASRNVQFGRSVGDPALESEILYDGLEIIENSKRVELEGKWKKLRLEEYELYLKRVELIRDQTTLILEALKSGES